IERKGRWKSIRDYYQRKKRDYLKGTGTDSEKDDQKDNFSKKFKHLRFLDNTALVDRRTISSSSRREELREPEKGEVIADVDTEETEGADNRETMQQPEKLQTPNSQNTQEGLDTQDEQQILRSDTTNNVDTSTKRTTKRPRYSSDSHLSLINEIKRGRAERTALLRELLPIKQQSQQEICDPVTNMFFKSLAATVSTFSPLLKAKVKAETITVVSRQGEEVINTFITDLKNKPSQCEFGALKDDLIKTMLITGMNDKAVRKKLLRENITLVQSIIRSNRHWRPPSGVTLVKRNRVRTSVEKSRSPHAMPTTAESAATPVSHNFYGMLGCIEKFRPDGDWPLYLERLKEYYKANGVPVERRVSVLITLIVTMSDKEVIKLVNNLSKTKKIYTDEQLLQLLEREMSDDEEGGEVSDEEDTHLDFELGGDQEIDEIPDEVEDELQEFVSAGWCDNNTTTALPFSGQQAFPGRDLLNGNEPVDYFNLFFTDQFLEMIVQESNDYAESIFMRAGVSEYSRITSWKPLTVGEMKVFLGLLFSHGDFESSYMSRNRFFLIMRCMHFAKNASPEDPAPQDRLYKVRPLITHFNERVKLVYYPHKNLCIDESVMLWRGRLFFRVYIQNKRHKYGVKFYLLTEPNGFILRCIVYSGKSDVLAGVGHAEKIVNSLTEDFYDAGHSLFMDNYYNSVGLAERLLEKKTNCTGTLRKDRKENPKEVGQMVLLKEDDTPPLCWRMRRIVRTFLGADGEVRVVDVLTKGADNLYKPILWYFEPLFFLLDQETTRQSTADITERSSNDEELHEVATEDTNPQLSSFCSGLHHNRLLDIRGQRKLHGCYCQLLGQQIPVALHCCEFPESNTNDNLAKALYKVCAAYHITGKAGLCVTDNAASILKAVKEKKNLIVTKAVGLDEVDQLLDKVRKILSHLRRNPHATVELKRQQLLQSENEETTKSRDYSKQQQQKSVHCSRNEVEQHPLHDRPIFGTIKTASESATADWADLRDVTTLLRPFLEKTEEVSGEKYATASSVVCTNGFMHVFCTLAQEQEQLDVGKKVLQLLESGVKEGFRDMENSDTNNMYISGSTPARACRRLHQSEAAVDRLRRTIHGTAGTGNALQGLDERHRGLLRLRRPADYRRAPLVPPKSKRGSRNRPGPPNQPTTSIFQDATAVQSITTIGIALNYAAFATPPGRDTAKGPSSGPSTTTSPVQYSP
ncbi:hypothetical protein ILUMI_02580, partial [Ignelater luminosus]